MSSSADLPFLLRQAGQTMFVECDQVCSLAFVVDQFSQHSFADDDDDEMDKRLIPSFRTLHRLLLRNKQVIQLFFNKQLS